MHFFRVILILVCYILEINYCYLKVDEKNDNLPQPIKFPVKTLVSEPGRQNIVSRQKWPNEFIQNHDRTLFDSETNTRISESRTISDTDYSNYGIEPVSPHYQQYRDHVQDSVELRRMRVAGVLILVSIVSCIFAAMYTSYRSLNYAKAQKACEYNAKQYTQAAQDWGKIWQRCVTMAWDIDEQFE